MNDSKSTFKPRYELIYRANPQDESEKKWYAKSVTNGVVGIDQLAKVIANRCTVTRHDAKAVVSALQEVIGEYISMGCSVHLEDLGYFRLELRGKGSLTADKFSSSFIENTLLRFRPSEGMKTIVKNLTTEWMSNGVADTKACQEQLKKEQGA